MNRLIQIMLGVLICSSYAAADNNDVRALNQAWRDYVAAQEQSNPQLQLDAAKRALEAGKRALKRTDDALLSLHINYANSLYAMQRTDDARDAYEDALKLIDEVRGKDAIEALDVLPNYADTLAAFRSPARQLKAYRRALAIVKREVGDDSMQYANLAFRAAVSTYEMSKSTNGWKLMLEARDIFEATIGEHDITTGLANFHLGKFQLSRGNEKKSIEFLLQALPSFEGAESGEPGVIYEMHTRAMLVEVYETLNMSDEATEHCVAVGELSPQRETSDYQPLFRMTPRYPQLMRAARREGSVVFEFTIDEDGFVRDPKIIERAEGRKIYRTDSVHRFDREDMNFDAAALEALERFRYAPRVVDGKPVPVSGVKTRISFVFVD